MFTSFSGISFLYTCNAAELLLVVEIKLKEEYFMLTQKASDTWGSVLFFKAEHSVNIFKMQPDEK